MEVKMEDNIININLSEEEIDKIKEIYSEGHAHFRDGDKEIIINKK